MKYIAALLLLLIAVPVFAQNGGSNPITTHNIDNILYVDGVKYSQTDIGAGINAAYAACVAAARTSCAIVIPPGNFTITTPIVLANNGYYPSIYCSPFSTLTYASSTGTAVTLNPGSAGLPHGWGIIGCKFTGQGSGTSATAFMIGGTNGAVGARLQDVQIGLFGTGITFGTNVQDAVFEHVVAADNGQNFNIPDNLANTGELVNIHNSTFAMTTAVWSATCFEIGAGSGTFYNLEITDTSLDQCGYTQKSGVTNFSNLHMEDPVNASQSAAWIQITGNAQASFANATFISEQANLPGCTTIAHCFIDTASTAQVNINGGNFTIANNAGAQLYAVHVCATCAGIMTGTTALSGTPPIIESSVDTGGLLGKLGTGGITLIGANDANGTGIIANTAQTISGVTGTLFGWLHNGTAHLGEVDLAGNMGIAGTFHAPFLEAAGSGAGLSNGSGQCAAQGSQAGGAWAGSFVCTTAGGPGAFTIRITPGITAPHGWTCVGSDVTSGAVVFQTAASSSTYCTIGGTASANDVITFSAVAY